MGRTGLLDGGREGHLHPLTLFALTLLALIQAFLANQLVYALVLALSFLVLLDVSPASFLRQLALFAVACGVVQLILHVDIGYVTSIFLGVAVLVVRVFPVVNIGCALMMTSSSKLLASMRKLHVPNRAAVGAVIGLRFLDEMGGRVKEIKRGMRVRGLRPSPLRPVHAFESLLRSPCVQVPARERDARLLRDFERNRSGLRKDELPKSLLRSA